MNEQEKRAIRKELQTGSFSGGVIAKLSERGVPIGIGCQNEMERVEETEDGVVIWQCPRYYNCRAVTFIEKKKKPKQLEVGLDGEINYN